MTKENVKVQAADLPAASDYSNLDLNDPTRKDNVEAAVHFINEKLNEYVYKGSIEIGDYVLKHFFDNSIELATSRKPNKPESYNNLCASGALAVDAKQLSIMVRVAAQEKFFVEKEIDTTGLSYTHKACLVKIFDENIKKSLIKDCIANNWTTKTLDEAIGKHLRPEHEKNLVDMTTNSLSKIEIVSKFLDDNNINDKITELDNMDKRAKKAYMKKVEQLKGKVDVSISKLQMLSSNCDTILQQRNK
ncbi:MAG: hypothetical protein AB7U45_04835 [Desulfamplus sp.]